MSWCSGVQGPSLDVRIKWPNDLMAEGLKLGGILCHSAYSNRQFVSTIGIGLNLANRQPTICVDALIESAHAKAGLPGHPTPVSREVRMACLTPLTVSPECMVIELAQG